MTVAASVRANGLSLGAVPSSIVGPAARDVCSPEMEIPVALRGDAGSYHPGKLSLKTVVSLYDESRDTDTLKLVCLP